MSLSSAVIPSGGIYLDSSAAVIAENLIHGNTSINSSGGGIHVHEDSDAWIVGNWMVNNVAVFGGGITSDEASPIIERNVIENNFGDPRGGGLSCIDGNPLIVDNFIVGNRAAEGGAIECNDADAIVLNNTIIGNKGTDTGVVLLINNSHVDFDNNIIAFSPAGKAIHTLTGATASIDYNCFFGNTSETFGGTAEPGVGNVFQDPGIVELGSWNNSGTPEDLEDDRWIPGDEHVRLGSVCIDAGDPNFVPRDGETDIDGGPRVLRDEVDIGADEVPMAGLPGSGDFDGDGDVNLIDFGAYLDCAAGPNVPVSPAGCTLFDFDADQDVDWSDFGELQAAYTRPPG